MKQSLQILLHRLIDYAGLFPSDRLSMKESVANFKAYRAGEHAEVLNRFVLPATGLDEFAAALDQAHDGSEWELSAVVGPDAETDIANIIEFNRHISKNGASSVIRSVEIKAGDPQVIAQYQALIPKSVDAYFEIPCRCIDDCVAALAEAEAYAKLRTGGETPETFPSGEEIGYFLAACSFANVPFKCTAGLHYPISGVYPYAERQDKPSSAAISSAADAAGASGKMHGFLNVFVAAALAQKGATVAELAAVLEEQSAQAFEFERSGIGWHGYTISNQELASVRSSFGISFDSCSFTEPLDDLRALKLL